ncbi:hypothetical protein QO010_003269 [Caulobacter ginsengisoli]|uniref:DUF995 domain-containing protein n=1 Tax=Caulobacter ginsengisoli TaxID=400775 RepID=A0ABU0IVT0_9CAUL|nr:hypothetical protein [Caulobacter ginsengisoli]MDQ0465480.1 hypothetical protein [Caulobacter ginsengisoli]
MWRPVRFALVLAALAAAPAFAQLVPPGQLGPLNGEGPIDTPLRQVWHVREGDWVGTWTPQGGDGTFYGEWFKGEERTVANLRIRVTGRQVIVNRRQDLGYCTYTGQLQPRPVGGLPQVLGTYRCTWSRQPLRWSAIIGG